MAQKEDQTIDIGLTGRKKVLVAEDEQNIASLLEDWLSDVFEVILAYNGAAALQKAKWNKPDVLLLDIMMPDTGGYEVVCALQGDVSTAKIPVIVMTAKNFDDSTVKLIKAEPNVFGFLNKPFKPDELKKQILQVMSGQRTFAAPPGRHAAPSAPAPRAIPQVPVPPAARPSAPLPPPSPGIVLPPAPLSGGASLEFAQGRPSPAAPPPSPRIPSGLPEIVPTSPVQPLPPFLRPTPVPHGPPSPPAPVVAPRAAPPPPPPPAPPAPFIEPTSALPPEEPVPVMAPEAPPALEPHVRPEPPLDLPEPKASRPDRRQASRAAALEASEEGGSSLLLLKLAFWAGKAAAKAGIFILGVFFAAETTCRWTESALGREVFLPPLRPSRNADLPHFLPSGSGWARGGVDYSINEWGLRGGKVNLLKAPNTVRVMLLGGTALFGEGLGADQTVAGQLRTLLAGEQERPSYEVVSGGAWGYSPQEQWVFFEDELAQLKPDVVVWLLEERPDGFPSSRGLRELAGGSWLASGMFKDSHFARLLLHRDLADKVSPRKTDFLAMVQPAEKFVRQSDAKFLYAVFPARVLERSEWEELPGGQRVGVDEAVRTAYLRGAPAASAAVARDVFEKLRSLRKGG